MTDEDRFAILTEMMNDARVADGDSIEERARFDFVRYANCWEDADILVEALRPAPGKRLLSIASAGDNALALLASGSEVVAADLSAAQLACVELRCAGFRNLQYDDLLAFLGVTESNSRAKTYRQLRGGLSPSARQHWDAHAAEIAGGIIHFGKFESYFRTFRKRVLPFIHSQSEVAQLLDQKSAEERERFWDQKWNNRRWRWLLKVFFSQFLMERLGRDREFFRYVEGSIAEQIQRRAHHAMTVLSTDQNPYLQYIATGNYRTALPRYLRIEHFDAIRQGLDQLTLFHGPIQQAAAVHRQPGFDGMNLSDIFEYVSEATMRTVYGELLKTANVGARLAYWNAFVPRRCPDEFRRVVTSCTEQAEAFFARDKAFFYGRFHLDELVCEIDSCE